MKAKEIFLLIFIIIVGVSITQIHEGEFDFNIGWGDNFLFGFGYEEFVYEETEKIESPFPEELHINNSHGSIEIFGSDVDMITISFTKRIWRKDEEDAQEVAKELKMFVELEAQTLNISTNRQEFKRKNFETDFIIFVPEGLNVTVVNSYGLVRAEGVGHADITNRYGEVDVADIRGELMVISSHEDIEIKQVESNCIIEASYSSITISNILGTIEIENKHGSLTMEDITNDVVIRSPYSDVYGWNISGALDIENSYEKIELTNVGPVKIVANHSLVDIDGANGNINITNRYDKVRLQNITGNVFVDGKNLAISGKDVHGDEITLSSTYEDIEFNSYSGKTSISLSHGDLHLSPSPLTFPLEVNCSHVDIKFFWPGNERYPLEAQAEQGDIQWELNAEVDYQKDNGKSVIKAFLEETDKPTVFLSTTYGTIWIEESIII